MTRLIYLTISFIILHTLQVTFVASLPHPFDRIELLILAAAYATQFLGKWPFLSLLFMHGLVLDMLGLSAVPMETLSYAMVAIIGRLSAQHLFSNRSFYGMSATVLVMIATLTLSRLVIAIGATAVTQQSIQLTAILEIGMWQAILGIVILFFIFPLAQPTRELLRNLRLVD